MAFSTNVSKFNAIVKSPYFIILGFGILWRVILSFVFDVPAIHSDSRHYIELAKVILTGHLSDYEGWRTPGYALLLILSGMNTSVLVLLQSIMGLSMSLMVFDLLRDRAPKLALVVALFVTSLLHSIAFEFAVLTELSAQFMLTLTVWFIVKKDLIRLKAKLADYTLATLFLTFLLLVRPMYVFVTPLFVIFMSFSLKKQELLTGILKLLIIALLPLGTYHGWNMLNYRNIGWYTVTPFYGINLAQHSHAYFDKLPDSQKELKEIYLEKKQELDYQKEKPESLGGYYNYFFIDTCETRLVWASCGEWGKRQGLEGAEYTHALYDIFKQLIIDNPSDYFKGIVTAWIPFWNYSNYIMVDGHFYNPPVTKMVWRVQKMILLCSNLLFLILIPFSVFSSLKNRKLFGLSNFLAAIVLASSLSQAMVTYGDNNRFAFPSFLLLLVFVVVSLWRLRSKKTLTF